MRLRIKVIKKGVEALLIGLEASRRSSRLAARFQIALVTILWRHTKHVGIHGKIHHGKIHGDVRANIQGIDNRVRCIHTGFAVKGRLGLLSSLQRQAGDVPAAPSDGRTGRDGQSVALVSPFAVFGPATLPRGGWDLSGPVAHRPSTALGVAVCASAFTVQVVAAMEPARRLAKPA